MLLLASTDAGEGKTPPRRNYCLNCRELELRLTEDGSAVYWCLTKCRAVGPSVLGRVACSDYEPWRPLGGKGDE